MVKYDDRRKEQNTSLFMMQCISCQNEVELLRDVRNSIPGKHEKS